MKTQMTVQTKKNTFRAFYPLLAICLTATILCSYGVVRELITRRQSYSYYATLASEAGIDPEATTRITLDEGLNSAKSTWEPHVDFEALRAANPGLVAWIRCEGTTVNYPVVLGVDNEYYLNHLPDGTKNKMGSIFLDYRCSPDLSDRNIVIYGHHMKNGDMFGALESFKSQAFYDEYATVAIYTPNKDYIVELFAGYLVNAEQETLPLDFEDSARFERYIAGIRQRSLFESDVDVSEGDRLVTLSTCTNEFSNARFVLVGKLVEA